MIILTLIKTTHICGECKQIQMTASMFIFYKDSGLRAKRGLKGIITLIC